VAVAVSPHRLRLVRAEPEVRARLRDAEQREAGGLVFRVIPERLRVVERAGQHSRRTGYVPALLAQAGEVEPRAPRGIEDGLVGARTHDASRAVGQFELDAEVGG
jgi:hypothetical protein